MSSLLRTKEVLSIGRVRLFLLQWGLATVTVLVLIRPGYAQTIPASETQARTQSHTTAATVNAGLSEGTSAETGAGVSKSANFAGEAGTALDSAIPPAVQKQLQIMQDRIHQLELELKHNHETGQPSSAEPVANATKPLHPAVDTAGTARPQEARTSLREKPKSAEPFAYADWTWLNGTPRTKDPAFDSKFFTPEVRFDTHYVFDFNHPQDDTMGGSAEIFRSNEVQIEQISVGGDFHWDNVRGRLLTMNGMFGVTTPRNDASTGRGQWNLRGAYRYVSEAWGGYHFNVNHGLNVDAGIFVSYIGLFSYYNFDNWAYQPSFVSSNTPWFFNGLRIQWFPTDKLKIEPWIINGWQSYGRFGSRPGLGGQILYRPKPWLSLAFNNYGMGEDTLGLANGKFGRSRIHTDDSVEVKYYDRPQSFLDKMAFSLTGDLGCEYGGPVSLGLNTNCHHNTATSKKQTFAGWMLYNRFWFNHDKYGLTIGGGAMDNPGRYLVLLPPINGADAVTGTPYFTANPGDPFKAWDGSFTFDWMPKQYVTFRWEYGYRHANVPYWSGRGGITPPGGNTGSFSNFGGLNNGVGQLVPGTTFAPGPVLSTTPGLTCVAGSTGWCPDLRKDEASIRMAIMVKF